MDKGDIYIISGAEAEAVNHRGPINIWPQINHSVHWEGSNIMVSAPRQEGLLVLAVI